VHDAIFATVTSHPPTPHGRVPASTFAGIVAIAADAIITVDAAQVIIFFNEGAERIFGWRADEVLGQPLAMLVPHRFRGAHEGHVRGFGHGDNTARRMGERSEIAGLRRNGEEFPAEASISRVTNEGETVFTVVLRDVTDRKRSADRLRFLAEAGETLAEQRDMNELLATVAGLPVPVLADAAVVEVAFDGVFMAESAHADEQVRDALTEGRLRAGRGMAAIPPATQRLGHAGSISAPPDEATIGSPPPAWVDAGTVARLGNPRALAVQLRARGELLGVVHLLRTRTWDESERVLAEDYARRAALAIDAARLLGQVRRALQARDDVTGIVSHDLRNPVQAIKLLAGAIAESDGGVPEHVLEQAGIIQRAAEQMDRLIQDLLDAARIDAGRLQVTPRPEQAAALVSIAIEPLLPLAAARRQSLTVDADESLPSVMADAGRIAQVLSNLVGNAMKFTPDGGRIAVQAAVDDGVVVVRVTDSGLGIPETQRERIFDRWVQLSTSSAAGAGLGLPIARGIVEAHGGRLWHEDAADGGSVFAFTLRIVG
jgi:PAS domain S-box-containing protein